MIVEKPHDGTDKEIYNHTRKNWGYRLIEPPVADSLTALATIPQSKKLMVVGGTAVALYCYDKIPYQKTRQTDDIDVKYNERLTKTSFRGGLGKEAVEALKKFGYSPTIHPRGHRDFSVVVIPQDDLTEAFYICTPNLSQNYWRSKEQILQKEFENLEEIEIPLKKEKIQVAGLEDALAPKIAMMRDKDKLDIASALKYGPGIEMKRLEDMLFLWSNKEPARFEDYVKAYKAFRSKVL